MCELASQAYGCSLSAGYLRFPSNVELWVDDGYGFWQKSGQGNLVVKDNSRIDIGYPIATEDQVDLLADGCFRYLGRKKEAPLKGCSLVFEDIWQKKQACSQAVKTISHSDSRQHPDPGCNHGSALFAGNLMKGVWLPGHITK